jgi:site-specific recombinase XerD
MLERFYKYPKVLKRMRGGALGGEMDCIAARLSEVGYTRASARIYLAQIARFSRFAAEAGHQGPASLGRDVVKRFLLELGTPSARVGAQTAIGHALRHVQERFPAPPEQEALDADGQLLVAFGEHLRQVRGLQPRTCDGMLLVARRVLGWYREHRPGQPLSAVTGKDVLALASHFSALSANGRTRSAAASYTRSFLRYLGWAGVVDEDLARLVPRTRYWRMAHLPGRLGWDDVRRVIDSIDVTDPVGVRDRALVLLLATTGVRNQELRLLELQDVRWRDGEVLVRRTKARRERVVPLLEEAGSALAEYVLHARPRVPAPQVFLCQGPPARPLRYSSTVAAIVRRRLALCGLQPARSGAHLLRHSLATRLVGQALPIKEIADLLGHRSIDTTAIYVKVALPQLAGVALPFPGGES